MRTRVHERFERTVLITRGQDRNPQIVVGEKRARLRKVTRQADALRGGHEKLVPFALRPNRVGIDRRRQTKEPTGIFIRARIKMGTQLFDQSNLLVVTHT